MKIGVVTVTYNSGEDLPAFLRCIFSQKLSDFELFIVDNGSVDDTAEILSASRDPRVHLTLNGKNLGVAAGNNQGIAFARERGCDAVLLVNNDTEFDDTLFSNLVDELTTGSASAVVPRIMYHDKPDVAWFGGGHFRGPFNVQVVHEGFNTRDYRGIRKAITYAPTCCMLVDIKAIDEIGTMDEKYFVYYDDVDFCYRMFQKNRFTMTYLPSTVMLHKLMSSSGGKKRHYSRFQLYYRVRNTVYFCVKHKKVYFLPVYAIQLFGLFTMNRRIQRKPENLRTLAAAFWKGLLLRYV